MTEQEKKILREIRKWLGKDHKPYMFWFSDGTPLGKESIAIGWQGGFELSLDQQFRNQYTIPAPYKRVVKNW